ncbi:DUF1778 domain-containing protein [Demequina sp.]|uniref:type II toxin-antitoxin system TacA family antitoxin n=1 Tax=Demequina sp. TaxID=2050685 RepID=UPI003D0A9927
MSSDVNRKDQRLEFRVSDADRDLFARAAAASGVSVSTFATDELRVAAQRVLADRTDFLLSPAEWALWEALNDRPARDLPGLRTLMERPSLFVD